MISSTHFNNTINDIATALSLCLTKDGQQTATANINFGGFRATNVGITAIAGSVGTPAINVSDAGTGLYRSAASELAVTVAGTQRARFDGTGLIVTGVGTFSGATSTTTLTASTSVVTPLVGTATAADFAIQINGVTRWIVDAAAQNFTPASDNSADIGSPAKRIGKVVTPIIDSGTAGSLLFRTGNGTIGLTVRNVASGINFLSAQAGAAGNPPIVSAIDSSETNVGIQLYTKGTGTFSIGSDVSGAAPIQFQVLHTASANRNITVTGSNGGNPTLSTTAGSLAITPSVVLAGSLVFGATPSVTGLIALPNNGTINARNSANSADLSVIAIGPQNGINDIIFLAATSNGAVIRGRSGGVPPTTSDLLIGQWTVWRDTGGATTKLYYNNAGAIQSVALA